MSDDWWKSDPVATPPSAGGDWWKSDPVAKPAPEMPWSDVASQAWRNAPASAIQFAKNTAQPFLHPIDTATALANVGEGALEKAGVMSGSKEVPYADAVGDYFKNRYGSIGGLKQSLATDPVGVAGDASAALTAGGALLARAPEAAAPEMIGEIGGVARALGDAVNPAAAVTKPVAAALRRLGAGSEEKIVAPTVGELRDASHAAYQDPAIKELEVTPNSVKGWKDAAVVALNNEGFTDISSPKTFGLLARLDNAPAGSSVTGQGLDTIRKALRKVAGGTDPTEKATASKAISALDDFVGNIPKNAVIRGDPDKVASLLSDARGNYASAKRAQTIEQALDKAKIQAGAANSGMNVDNATRQRIKEILTNSKRLAGFSKDEIVQMRRIVAGTLAENATRRLGNMMGGGGGVGSTVVGSLSAAGGAASAGPWGIAAGAVPVIVGYGLKKLSGAMSAADVRKLDELVRARSPLADQMRSTVGKWSKASAAAQSSKTPMNIARLLLASRNLSTNLIDAGITATPDSLAQAAASKRASGND